MLALGLGDSHPTEVWSLRAQDYEDLYALEESLWWFVGMREVTRAVLDPFCPPGRGRDVLDAGCGTGGMLNWLERYAGGGSCSAASAAGGVRVRAPQSPRAPVPLKRGASMKTNPRPRSQ